METGVNGAYEWLEADHDLRTFLKLCPEAIAGRYLAITAVDSGTFVPSEADEATGWKTIGGIAYSPRLESAERLPGNCCCRGCSGFDEWYVFERPTDDLGALSHGNFFTTELVRGVVFAFVNSFLRLSGAGSNEITGLFWRQMEWMQPESYICDGMDCLIFATRNKELFQYVHTALSEHPAD